MCWVVEKLRIRDLPLEQSIELDFHKQSEWNESIMDSSAAADHIPIDAKLVLTVLSFEQTGVTRIEVAPMWRTKGAGSDPTADPEERIPPDCQRSKKSPMDREHELPNLRTNSQRFSRLRVCEADITQVRIYELLPKSFIRR